MANKYLKYDPSIGGIREQEAQTTSSGTQDAGKIVALNSDGKLDLSMFPSGIGPQVVYLTASENLSAGDFVNIWNDSGTAKVRKADASTAGKEANGFVLEAVTANSMAAVYFTDENTQLSGLTPGAVYYLSAATPGGITTSPPSGSGNIVQRLGRASSATSLFFQPSDPIVLA